MELSRTAIPSRYSDEIHCSETGDGLGSPNGWSQAGVAPVMVSW